VQNSKKENDLRRKEKTSSWRPRTSAEEKANKLITAPAVKTEVLFVLFGGVLVNDCTNRFIADNFFLCPSECETTTTYHTII
jgi:hypothetical protein